VLGVLSITFPIFACIALGFGAVRLRIFSAEEVRALNRFVLNVALPALLFGGLARYHFAEVFDKAYLVTYGLAALIVLGITFAVFRAQGIEPSRLGVAVLGTCVSNSAMIGFPIMQAAHPSVAAKVLALNTMVENFLVMPICFAIMAGGGGWRNVILSTLRRPMILGILAGLLVSLSGFTLPVGLERLVMLLGTATAPLALFSIGGALAALKVTGNRLVAAQIVVAKLALHPAAVLAVLALLPLAGLALPPDLVTPVILSAAMPMFTTYVLFAGEQGHEGMASIALLAATSIAFVSLSVLLIVLP